MMKKDSGKIDNIIGLLKLSEHPREGGYFAETYRSMERVPKDVLPPAYSNERSLSTAIYYMLTPDTFSRLHRLKGDEIFHFYRGDPVEMLQLFPDSGGRLIKIGSDLAAGFRPQVLVPKNVWQGSRLIPGGRFALMGTTMAPGFDYADYEEGDRERLMALFPDFKQLIILLTR